MVEVTQLASCIDIAPELRRRRAAEGNLRSLELGTETRGLGPKLAGWDRNSGLKLSFWD